MRLRVSLTILLLVLFSSVALALPPGQELGLMGLLYPKTPYYQKGVVSQIHIHAFTETGNLLLPSNYDCVAHIYDGQNNHVLEANMTDDSNNLEKVVTYTFTETGPYTYIVWCNSTNEAGEISEAFFVNNNGKEPNPHAWLPITILISVLGLGLLWVSFNIKLRSLMFIKALMFLLGTINILLLGLIPIAIVYNTYDASEFYPLAYAYFVSNGIVMILFIYLYGFKHLLTVLRGGKGE